MHARSSRTTSSSEMPRTPPAVDDSLGGAAVDECGQRSSDDRIPGLCEQRSCDAAQDVAAAARRQRGSACRADQALAIWRRNDGRYAFDQHRRAELCRERRSDVEAVRQHFVHRDSRHPRKFCGMRRDQRRSASKKLGEVGRPHSRTG